jgi:hypothetical protein
MAHSTGQHLYSKNHICNTQQLNSTAIVQSSSAKWLSTAWRRRSTAFVQLSTAFVQHSTAFVQHNTAFVQLSTAFVQHSTAFVQHNTAFVQLSTAFVQHSTAFVQLSTAFVKLSKAAQHSIWTAQHTSAPHLYSSQAFTGRGTGTSTFFIQQGLTATLQLGKTSLILVHYGRKQEGQVKGQQLAHTRKIQGPVASRGCIEGICLP